MKKSAKQKQVSERKQKLHIERRSFEEDMGLFLPFRFNFLPDYPLVVNHRLYKIRNSRGKRS